MTAGPAVKQLTVRGELPAGMGTVQRFPTTFQRRMQRNGFFSPASVEGRFSFHWQLVSFLGIVSKASFNSNVKRIYKQYFPCIKHTKTDLKLLFLLL